jgi:hypothetical protein
MEITHEWIGILALAGSAFGAILGLFRKIDKQGNEIASMRENRFSDKSDLKEFSSDIKKDIKHLEATVGQMQTNLRVFINEGNEKTNERIYQMEKAFLSQIKEVNDRVDAVKDDLHEHKHEVNEKIITHLSK